MRQNRSLLAHFENESGSLMIQILIAIGIMGILILTFSSIFQYVNRQQSYNQQKVDSLTAQSLISTQFLSNIENCNLSLQGLPFDVGSPPTELALTELVVGPATNVLALVKTASSTQPGGNLANSIVMNNITADANPGDFRATVVVDFKNTVMDTRDMSFPIFFKASPATNTITGCRVQISPSNIVVLNLGGVQNYPAASCPGGWMISPNLSARRLDCGTGDTWVAVAIPNVDGTLRYDMTVEFGSPKGGGSGHGWYYFVRGLSQRYYMNPLTFDPSAPHSIGLEFYIGNRNSNFAANASAFSVFTPATPATAHPCIQLIETTMMIECLK